MSRPNRTGTRVVRSYSNLTAYCLALEHVPDPLPVIVGFGAGMERV